MARLIISLNRSMVRLYMNGGIEPISINTDMRTYPKGVTYYTTNQRVTEINLNLNEHIKDYHALLTFSDGSKELVYLKRKG